MSLVTLFDIVIILFSIVLHEVSHGFMAYHLGDPTAKYAGRLTLNPIKHIDLFGSIVLPFLTYITAGVVFGYAKPVPYNPLNLRDQTYGPAKVAIAGPLSNFFIALIFGLTLRFSPGIVEGSIIWLVFSLVVLRNIALGIFNLVPIPPLDGHWILLTFIPGRFREVRDFIQRYGIFIFVIFVIFFAHYLGPLINFLFTVIVGN